MQPDSLPVTDTQCFSTGFAQSDDPDEVLPRCLQNLGAISEQHNVGFVFATEPLAAQMNHLVAGLRQHTEIRNWIGTTAPGICAGEQEYYGTAMAVMTAEIPENAFRILPTVASVEDDLESALGDWLRADTGYLGVVHGDVRNTELPGIIRHVARTLPGGFLVGGLGSAEEFRPQVARQVTGGGLSGIVFAGEVGMTTALTQGCSPIGPRHLISGCERNLVLSLDGRPALDVFAEDAGDLLARNPDGIAGYIFAALPVPHSDTNDYLVRNLIGVDTENRLLAIGDFPDEGQALQFCRRDGRTAWDDLHRMLYELRDRVGAVPRGGLYYSCLGRGRNLFGNNSEEIRAIRDVLGDFPLIGMFANGEIFHDRLYGYTGVLTLFL